MRRLLNISLEQEQSKIDPIFCDFMPLAGIGACVLNAARASQYYVVYSMESQENI